MTFLSPAVPEILIFSWKLGKFFPEVVFACLEMSDRDENPGGDSTHSQQQTLAFFTGIGGDEKCERTERGRFFSVESASNVCRAQTRNVRL